MNCVETTRPHTHYRMPTVGSTVILAAGPRRGRDVRVVAVVEAPIGDGQDVIVEHSDGTQESLCPGEYRASTSCPPWCASCHADADADEALHGSGDERLPLAPGHDGQEQTLHTELLANARTPWRGPFILIGTDTALIEITPDEACYLCGRLSDLILAAGSGTAAGT